MIDTQEYRLAPSGEGEQASTWKDKPHRLVYDLCRLREPVSTENIALTCVQLKHRLGELGLYKTMQAMESVVTAIGWELAERIEK